MLPKWCCREQCIYRMQISFSSLLFLCPSFLFTKTKLFYLLKENYKLKDKRLQKDCNVITRTPCVPPLLCHLHALSVSFPGDANEAKFFLLCNLIRVMTQVAAYRIRELPLSDSKRLPSFPKRFCKTSWADKFKTKPIRWKYVKHVFLFPHWR